MSAGRRQYPFDLIEPKWQRHWDEQQTFRAWNPGETVPANHPFAQRHANARPEDVPKYYILDMFPYPSGAGLHVGHPEGYTATDIVTRYNSWFNPEVNKAEPIETLQTNDRESRDSKRLAFIGSAPVWWCDQLGTVLSNEEIVDGKSEVGGFPVIRKPMRQWMLRITA